MEKMIVLGTDIFDQFIKDDGYYVDKTEILYELVAQSRNKVTLFTRPRRFGKTLAMSMMECFFDVRRNSRDIFNEMRIMAHHPDFCQEWMNHYPVLFLSFKDVEGLTFESAFKMLKTAFSDLCKKHAYLQEADKVDSDDVVKFCKLKSETADLEDVKTALKTLMRMMYAVYGESVISGRLGW